jgi:hypothetical protein
MTVKPSTPVNILRLIICVGFFIGIFQQPLGLPHWAGLAGAAVGLVCVIATIPLQRKASRGSQGRPDPAAVRRSIRIGIVLILLVTLSSPFWLPYTGTTLGFPELVISAFGSCALAIAAFLLGVWFRRRALTNRQEKG